MAKFKFRLEAVLKHRQLMEDQRKRGLAAALEQRQGKLQELRGLQNTISDSRKQLTQGLQGHVNLDQVSQFARFSGQARQRAQQLVHDLARMEQQVELARKMLTEAVKARKVMELLRERHYQQWLDEEKRRESAMLDELAVQGYARNTADPSDPRNAPESPGIGGPAGSL